MTVLAAALLLLSAFSAPASADAGPVAGRFDAYTFALEWTAAFCEGKTSLPECAAPPEGRFDVDHLSLHGLWPDVSGDSQHAYAYCGVDPSTRKLDKAPTWCRMPDLELAPAAAAKLATVMPGTATCLDRHEWYKHGSCSGLAPDDYFTRAADLVQQVAQTRFGKYLSANVGRPVDLEDLLAAWEADFGPGTRDRVSFHCTFARGSDMLLDVRLRLSTPLRPASELGSMLLPAGGRSDCPRTFLIDPFPR